MGAPMQVKLMQVKLTRAKLIQAKLTQGKLTQVRATSLQHHNPLPLVFPVRAAPADLEREAHKRLSRHLSRHNHPSSQALSSPSSLKDAVCIAPRR